jgi:hypothetical protein
MVPAPASTAPVFAAPRGFAPPASLPLQRKMKRLQKQLRSTSHALAKRRWLTTGPASLHIAEPVPQELPALAEVPPQVEAEALPQAAVEIAPLSAIPAPEPVPAPDTRLVELQYEVLDLRHKLEALSATPVLDAAAVTTLAAKAPAFTEVQYEVADLRHQVQALQAELAALKAPAAPAALKASQLEIADGQGRTVASISSDGVISCSSVVLRANT